MGFKFQVNNDVRWNISEVYLNKANERTPQLHYQNIAPSKIVEIVSQTDVLGNFGTSIIDTVENISDHTLGREESIVLDLGDHYVGTFSIDIDSVGSPMDAPLYLQVKFAEVAAELEYKFEDYDGWLSKSWIQEEYFHLDELPATLSIPRRYSCRYIQLKVIDTSPKWKAMFSNPKFVSQTSVERNHLKEIEIKDEQLKRIYDTSVKTLEDCMQLVYEDGPKRDRRLWIGDLRLQALANYSTFQDRTLVERCLYLFAAMRTEEGKISANVFTSPRYIPDDTFLFEYSLNFTTILFEHYEQFKDSSFVKDLYGVSKDSINLALQYVDEEGRFIEDENWPIFCDWSSEFDKTTAGQAMLIYTLRRFIQLAQIVNDKEVRKYEEFLHRMTIFSQDRLFDESKGLFIVEGTNEINIASQVWMVLAEVMSEKQNYSLMENTIEGLFPIKGIATPYMYHHINEALFVAGHIDEGVRLMKEYWGEMINLGADTFWEAFVPADPNFSPYDSPMINSYCHAWSCTPAYLIDKYLIK